MSLFKSKSIETDLAESQATLVATQQKLTAAETHVLELEENNTALAAERDAAKLEAQTVNEAYEASHAAYQKLAGESEIDKVTVATLASWMGVEGEVTKETISAVIDAKAHARALDIAAGQGCAAVPTDPGKTGNAEDEIKGEYEAAAQIEDPKARGAAFAKITAKLNRAKN